MGDQGIPSAFPNTSDGAERLLWAKFLRCCRRTESSCSCVWWVSRCQHFTSVSVLLELNWHLIVSSPIRSSWRPKEKRLIYLFVCVCLCLCVSERTGWRPEPEPAHMQEVGFQDFTYCNEPPGADETFLELIQESVFISLFSTATTSVSILQIISSLVQEWVTKPWTHGDLW